MNIRKNLPQEYDGNYPLSFTEQAIIIELSILNDMFHQQLQMPMVAEMDGGPGVTACFQRCVAAEILTFWEAGLLTDEFYESNKGILDEIHGIRPDITLDTLDVYRLVYDIGYMTSRYMVVLGHNNAPVAKQDSLYNDRRFFTPHEME